MRMNKMKIDGSKLIWRYKNLKFRGRDTMRIIKRMVDNKLKFRTTTELKIYFNLIMKKINYSENYDKKNLCYRRT